MSSDRPDQEDIPLTIAEFEKIAQTKLDRQVWDYYISGADNEISLRRNANAFDRLIIRPRILRDVSAVDTSATLFGQKFAFPVAIAPSAMQKLVGGDGELDNVRAAVRCGTFMGLSSNATSTMEEVMEAARSVKPREDINIDRSREWDPNLWFQIYISQDREKTAKLIKRAEVAGYTALVLTVDTPVLGNRINERKRALVLPSHLSLSNLDDPDPKKTAKPSLNREFLNARNATEARAVSIEASKRGLLNDSSLTWLETIPWLRQQTSKLKIIVKGVMTGEDALLSLQHGADAIVVSNHGGRQLDSVSSTIEALPEIVSVVRGRVPVIVDGGITRGSDVFKALALGADFTLIGRPALWGLAYDGQRGVEMVLDTLEREFARTMALAGCKDIGDITSDMLGVRKRNGFGIAKL